MQPEQQVQDPQVETGLTNQLIEDVPNFHEHMFIRQARTFIKGKAHPVTYYAAVRESLPKVDGVEKVTAMRLLTEIELTYINAVQMEFNASNEARGKGIRRRQSLLTSGASTAQTCVPSSSVVVPSRRCTQRSYSRTSIASSRCRRTTSPTLNTLTHTPGNLFMKPWKSSVEPSPTSMSTTRQTRTPSSVSLPGS